MRAAFHTGHSLTLTAQRREQLCFFLPRFINETVGLQTCSAMRTEATPLGRGRGELKPSSEALALPSYQDTFEEITCQLLVAKGELEVRGPGLQSHPRASARGRKEDLRGRGLRAQGQAILGVFKFAWERELGHLRHVNSLHQEDLVARLPSLSRQGTCALRWRANGIFLVEPVTGVLAQGSPPSSCMIISQI